MKKSILLLLTSCISILIHAQVSKTVNCTAGNLSTLISSTEKYTITDLIIKGNIDARDFLTMRDNLSKLATIDLSTVTILSYTGTLGTDGTSSISYPSDAIPNSAFCKSINTNGKSTLTSIKFPNSLKLIGNNSFFRCYELTSIIFTPSITNIGDYAFSYCYKLKSISLPSSLKYIGISSFQNDAIQTLNLPTSLTDIGNYAFSGCSSLKSLNIPTSLKLISDGCFGGCYSLESILFDLPSSITSIGSNAFSGCNNLISISITESVVSIGENAFSMCKNLQNVDFSEPSSLTTIGDGAFSCKGGVLLKDTLLIPSSVKTIGNTAFGEGWSKINSLTIPTTVTSIGVSAFYSFNSLTSIYSYKIIPLDSSILYNWFPNTYRWNCVLYVPLGSKTAYKKCEQWKDFNIVEGKGFWIFNTKINISNKIDTSKYVKIASNTSYSISSSASWLTVNKINSSGDDTIRFSATANSDTIKRIAYVTISTDGVTPEIITITQDASKVTGLQEENKSEILISPNPTYNNFTINNDEIATIELVNSVGIKVLTKTILPKENISTTNLIKGIYYVIINRNNHSTSHKLIIE